MKRQIFGYPILSWVIFALFAYWIVLQLIPEDSMSDFVSATNLVITTILIFLVGVLGFGLWIILFALIGLWVMVGQVKDSKKDFIKWRREGSPWKTKSVAIHTLKVLAFPVVVYLLLMLLFGFAHFYLRYVIYDFFGISATSPDLSFLWNLLG